MNRNFKPRNFTAVFLSVTWLLISIFFITQGTMVTLWSILRVWLWLSGLRQCGCCLPIPTIPKNP